MENILFLLARKTIHQNLDIPLSDSYLHFVSLVENLPKEYKDRWANVGYGFLLIENGKEKKFKVYYDHKFYDFVVVHFTTWKDYYIPIFLIKAISENQVKIMNFIADTSNPKSINIYHNAFMLSLSMRDIELSKKIFQIYSIHFRYYFPRATEEFISSSSFLPFIEVMKSFDLFPLFGYNLLLIHSKKKIHHLMEVMTPENVDSILHSINRNREKNYYNRFIFIIENLLSNENWNLLENVIKSEEFNLDLSYIKELDIELFIKKKRSSLERNLENNFSRMEDFGTNFEEELERTNKFLEGLDYSLIFSPYSKILLLNFVEKMKEIEFYSLLKSI